MRRRAAQLLSISPSAHQNPAETANVALKPSRIRSFYLHGRGGQSLTRRPRDPEGRGPRGAGSPAATRTSTSERAGGARPARRCLPLPLGRCAFALRVPERAPSPIAPGSARSSLAPAELGVIWFPRGCPFASEDRRPWGRVGAHSVTCRGKVVSWRPWTSPRDRGGIGFLGAKGIYTLKILLCRPLPVASLPQTERKVHKSAFFR